MNGSNDQKPKYGEGHAKAMGRLGLEELRNAVYPSANAAEQNTLYGIYGTKTPGEVADERRCGDLDLTNDEEPKPGGYLAHRIQEAKEESRYSNRDRTLDIERD